MFLFFLAFILIFLLIIIMIIRFNRNNLDKEKLISFECGFNSFFLPRTVFSIQFFKILLIFLFFDIEIIIIFPLIYFNFKLVVEIILIFFIIFFLIFGLFFEFKEGSLE